MESRRIVEEIVEPAMMLIKSQPFQCIQVSTFITSCMLGNGLSAKCVYGDLKYYGTLLFKNTLTCRFEDAPSSNFDGHAWVEWDNNGVSYIIDASILFTVFSDTFQRAQPIVFDVFQQKFGGTGRFLATQEEASQSGLEHTPHNTLSNEFVHNYAERFLAEFGDIKTAEEYQSKLQGAW